MSRCRLLFVLPACLCLAQHKYSYAIVDNHLEKVGNYNVEPPGLFRGRGEHPKTGKLKARVMASDISINCAEEVCVPRCNIPGYGWQSVQHDPSVRGRRNPNKRRGPAEGGGGGAGGAGRERQEREDGRAFRCCCCCLFLADYGLPSCAGGGGKGGMGWSTFAGVKCSSWCFTGASRMRLDGTEK